MTVSQDNGKPAEKTLSSVSYSALAGELPGAPASTATATRASLIQAFILQCMQVSWTLGLADGTLCVMVGVL